MTSTKGRVVCLLFVMIFFALGTTHSALAQDTSATPKPLVKIDETNLDTELYLIVGSNDRGGDNPLPASLDKVSKQLHATLPFKNYNLVATLLNRVMNDGHLDLTWIGGSLLAPNAALAYRPTFSQFSIGRVKLVDSESGPVVQMTRFSYGARFPIQTGTTIAASGTTSAAQFEYQQTGLNTDISIKPDEPGIVGTLNVGPSGDALIIVVSAKRAPR